MPRNKVNQLKKNGECECAMEGEKVANSKEGCEKKRDSSTAPPSFSDDVGENEDAQNSPARRVSNKGTPATAHHLKDMQEEENADIQINKRSNVQIVNFDKDGYHPNGKHTALAVKNPNGTITVRAREQRKIYNPMQVSTTNIGSSTPSEDGSTTSEEESSDDA